MAKCQFFRSGTIDLSECAHSSQNGDNVNRIKVTLGFKPKALAVFNDYGRLCIYDDAMSTTTFRFGSTANVASTQNLGTTTGNMLYSIDNDGFTFNKTQTASNILYYSAVGEVQ